MIVKTVISKFFTLFILVVLGLVAACQDPESNIKDLDKQELGNVIDKLYIENNDEPLSDLDTSQEQKTDIDLILSDDFEPASSISSSAIVESNIPDITVVVNETSSERQDNADLNENSDSSIESTSVDSVDSEADQEDTSTLENSFASAGFSDPVTNSETPAEKILRELLEEHPEKISFASALDEKEANRINEFCEKISARLNSVSMSMCTAANHRASPFDTVEGNPIVVSEFPPKEDKEPLGKILVIGGTHGDELTSVSTAYKWISNLNKYHSGLFHWHIAPALNADRVLSRPATRQNANGVDINRNLPTPDWDKQSKLWWDRINKDPRKNPGTNAASEPESKWIMHEIENFQPDAIVSIHAPYGLLDFDSPQLKNAPKKFGRLQLNLLGTYPGSLGNYAGIQKEIPVLTLELQNATAMPKADELNAIWTDMIRWLRSQLESN